MNWIILFIAGLFEVCWALGLKYSNNFSNIKWTIFTVITLILSMSLLSYALKTLPVGTAYGVWTGIGAVGTAIMGIVLFNDSKETIRIFFIGLIVIGIIGLKLVSRD